MIPIEKSVDLLRQIWLSLSLPTHYVYGVNSGLSLNAIASANGLGEKGQKGELAPVLWQRGKYGSVIDYCLQDVKLTWHVLRKALIDERSLIHPASKVEFPLLLRGSIVKRGSK